MVGQSDISATRFKGKNALSPIFQVKGKKRIVISASEIIRVFHPRAKPSEQETRVLRPVREQDPELAIQCVGSILCELGWVE